MFDKSGKPITKSAHCTFEEWKRRVDACIYHAIGLGADDLPDFGYRDAYDANRTPSATAKSAIRAARDF